MPCAGVNSPTAERTLRERQGDSCLTEAGSWDKGFFRTRKNPGVSNAKPFLLAPLPCLNLRPNPKSSSLHPRPPGQNAGPARGYLQTGPCGLSGTPGASLLLAGGGHTRDGSKRRPPKSPGPFPKAWPRPLADAISKQRTSQHPRLPLALLSRPPIRDKDTSDPSLLATSGRIQILSGAETVRTVRSLSGQIRCRSPTP